ncbi:hypothetical protein LTR47_009545 [Exophiala xenobiotica]|nr:hypothetical protein LTR92_007410 [Exophiala xenobiotica]KAK5225292.1 hypothetical protein LTR47_009545 [Exophiala xenobiotica]KAK5329531.1 hypothetical protein LTR93_001118 [Exophiala xenobiotica]KAK5360772.1 hypothetical protein LTR11_010108 [Exophiala xenobiotica]KAK5375079.1 hypothetical protein LTS03_005633 [Exophiala xenobiotica]
MFYLPSARRWALLSLILLGVIIPLRVSQRWHSSHYALLTAALQAYTQRDHQVTTVNVTDGWFSFTGGVFRSQSQSQPQHALGEYLSNPIPRAHPLIRSLQACATGTVNPTISHIRLPNVLYNITLTPPDAPHDSETRFFNPAVIPLPHWSSSALPGDMPKYILISRLVTAGFHQESHICLADICLPASSSSAALPPDVRSCTNDDTTLLGNLGGMRCITPPLKINIPPTPAEQCDGAWSAFPDIPGFHDPRAFWSGKGEPLILVNSASRYACVGLWLLDLRTIVPDLEKLLARGKSKDTVTLGRVMSYPLLTEITRNPRSSRASVEKNWVLWFPGREEAYVQYDLLGRVGGDETVNNKIVTNRTATAKEGNSSSSSSRDGTRTSKTTIRQAGRTFAKLIGNGYTTPNMTHPDEVSCFGPRYEMDTLGNHGHWHQGSNSLRLLLCTRAQARKGQCDEEQAVQDGRSVHFAIMHRKFTNEMDLPLRYERYVAVWESRAPFQMLAVSQWPLLMRNERANPWTSEQNWPDDKSGGWNSTVRGTMFEERMRPKRDQGEEDSEDFKSTAYFTYTPSLAWAWRPHSAGVGDEEEEDADSETMSRLGMGYLGDDVLTGIGLDDVSQVFARVKVDDLVQCMRLCPGVKFADEVHMAGYPE